MPDGVSAGHDTAPARRGVSAIWKAMRAEDLGEVAHIKRFFEVYHGDRGFREALETDPVAAAERLQDAGCRTRLEDLRPFYDTEAATRIKAGETRSRPVELWNGYIARLLEGREAMRSGGETAGFDPSFQAWRDRQMARCDSEIGDSSHAIVHPLAAYELSNGCSVGCWFCGISAEKFGGHLTYDPPSADLWRGVLDVMASRFGPAARNGFCYWATDPLDNPDYLHFVEDFAARNGVVPQTTTAIPLRNVALTRAVLERSARDQWVLNRFSVLSVNVLRRIHRTFTPEELLGVELVLQNREAVTRQAAAGRAFGRLKTVEGALESGAPGLKDGMRGSTIACVSGFLINMVQRTIRLVSPTAASDRCPDGFIVFGEATFDDVASFRGAIDDLCREHMQEWVPNDAALTFRADLAFTQNLDGFELTNGRSLHRSDRFGSVAALIARGEHSTVELAVAAQGQGVPFSEVIQFLSRTRAMGLLEQDAIGQVDHRPRVASPS